jgi:RNA polymerase sigma factor (sigma-70 family)
MPVQLEQVVSDASGGVRAEEILAAYDANERDLFGFVLAVTRDAGTAEDLVQETFLRLVRQAQAGRYPDNPRSWLYRVAVNLARGRARRRLVAERWRHLFVTRDVARSPEDELVGREQADILRGALAELSTDERMAFLLATDGHSGQEVAALIGRSEGATRTLLWRARRDLRRHLEREGNA